MCRETTELTWGGGWGPGAARPSLDLTAGVCCLTGMWLRADEQL